MTDKEIESELKKLLSKSYPKIAITVKTSAEDPTRRSVYFVEEKFQTLYPVQRYHYLIHAIPKEFYENHLKGAVWFELAPDETPDSLEYPDKELVQNITPDVMRCLANNQFFARLDDALSPTDTNKSAAVCLGDFRTAKSVLLQCNFAEDEFFDVLHVLMNQGAYCDCEILYNVAGDSRLKSNYWREREEQHF